MDAIRQVAQAPADGQVSAPEERAEVEAAEAGRPGPRGQVSMGEPTVIRTTEARRLVASVVRALSTRTNYRRPLTDFQRAAGITADGRYGAQSYNALRYFGGAPPMPFVRGDVNAPENAYPPGGVPLQGGTGDGDAWNVAGSLTVNDDGQKVTIEHQHNGGANV